MAQVVPVAVNDLTFKYSSRLLVKKEDEISENALKNISFEIPEGARIVLCGSNGAGKSTLMRIIAGKHLTSKDHHVRVFGKHSFRDRTLNMSRSYVSAELGTTSAPLGASYNSSVAYSADIKVKDMMAKLQSEYPERREKLLEVLGIDREWNMLRLSDGQRRRVQIFLSLLPPVRLLLLDEALAVLDVISRKNFLAYLKEESEKTGLTILSATHIFDAMDSWATHVMFIGKQGTLLQYAALKDIPEYTQLQKKNVYQPLLVLVEQWLTKNLSENKNEKEKEKTDENDITQACKNSAGGYADGRFCGFDTNLKQL